MDGPVEGFMKIMLHFRSVAPNFFLQLRLL